MVPFDEDLQSKESQEEVVQCQEKTSEVLFLCVHVKDHENSTQTFHSTNQVSVGLYSNDNRVE